MESRMFSAFNSNSNSNAGIFKQGQPQQQPPPPLLQQHCRPGCDSMDADDRQAGLMSKIARTGDSSTLFMSSGSQQHHAESDLRMLQMNSVSTAVLGSLVRSNSMLSDGRLGCSPTDSTTSDSAALLATAHEGAASGLLSVEHLRGAIRVGDPMVSMYDAARAMYQYPHTAYNTLQGHPSGLPLALSGSMQHVEQAQESSVMRNMMGGSSCRVLFTAGQLRELQHQALVLKYIMEGLNVPAELVNPIRASLNSASLSVMAATSPHLANIPWGGYRLAFGANADPEPGRCRRTDGKKWRCARDVVPEQKYCEKHIHRGRHRARKPTDNQQTGTSPGVSATSASTATSVASSVTLVAATKAPAGILSTVASTSCQQQQQLSQINLGIRSYSGTNSPSTSGLSVGSSLTASQYNQLSSLQPNALGSKDFRYMSGMSRSDMDLGAEQMLFAEASGSSRGMGQDYQPLNQHGLTTLLSINNSWRTATMQQSRAPSPSPPQAQPLKSSSPSLMQYSSPQIRTLLGQDPLSAETNSVNLHSVAQHNQQHHYSFLGGGFGSVEPVSNVGREPESHPLRHFFDDWPRSKDASAFSWSDVEDEKPNHNSSSAQLSISIPISSSDFNAPGSPPGKLKLSPLKLSMSRGAGEDDIPLGIELGVGMGLGINEDRHRHHQANWIPIAWETPVGGPLAEVLQSSTPRASKNSGLNLMTEGWEESPSESPHIGSSPRDKEGGGRIGGTGKLEASCKGGES